MKKRYTEIDGIALTPDFVSQNREQVIALRDAAISAGNLGYAMDLSFTIAILHDYLEKLKESSEASSEPPPIHTQAELENLIHRVVYGPDADAVSDRQLAHYAYEIWRARMAP